jgi:hypothetical protein
MTLLASATILESTEIQSKHHEESNKIPIRSGQAKHQVAFQHDRNLIQIDKYEWGDKKGRIWSGRGDHYQRWMRAGGRALMSMARRGALFFTVRRESEQSESPPAQLGRPGHTYEEASRSPFRENAGHAQNDQRRARVWDNKRWRGSRRKLENEIVGDSYLEIKDLCVQLN